MGPSGRADTKLAQHHDVEGQHPAEIIAAELDFQAIAKTIPKLLDFD